MKLKVIAHYETNGQDGDYEVPSKELGLSLEELLEVFDSPDGQRLEDTLDVTIDHGGDDDWYELDLPDSFDTKNEAKEKATRVFNAVIELIVAKKNI